MNHPELKTFLLLSMRNICQGKTWGTSGCVSQQFLYNHETYLIQLLFMVPLSGTLSETFDGHYAHPIFVQYFVQINENYEFVLIVKKIEKNQGEGVG